MADAGHNTPADSASGALGRTIVSISLQTLMKPSSLIKTSIAFLTVLACLTAGALGAASESRVLVYTKNQVGKGLYVHNNTPASVAALKKLGEENNFAVDVSDDPATFTHQNLKRYKALILDRKSVAE